MTNFFTFYKDNFFAGILLTIAFVFGTSTPGYAITYTSNAVTGNWSDGSSWVGGAAPTGLASDVIIIVSGANITADVRTTCGNVAINAATFATSLGINGGVTLTASVVTLITPTAAATTA